MKKIEFFAEPEDGTFKIPEKYQKDLEEGEIKVVLFIDYKKEKKRSFNKKFKALELDTRGFKFDRDEAHER